MTQVCVDNFLFFLTLLGFITTAAVMLIMIAKQSKTKIEKEEAKKELKKYKEGLDSLTADINTIQETAHQIRKDKEEKEKLDKEVKKVVEEVKQELPEPPRYNPEVTKEKHEEPTPEVEVFDVEHPTDKSDTPAEKVGD